MLRSGLVYKYKCGGCDPTYYSETKHHFKFRVFKHGISHLTDQKLKIDKYNLTAIQEYCNFATTCHPWKTFLF